MNKCEGKETTPVLLLYKGQGLPLANDTDILSQNDFVLCLQTPLQAMVLKRFGDQKNLCIDSSHETNSYNFTLVTAVLVVDGFGEGYPVVLSCQDYLALANTCKHKHFTVQTKKTQDCNKGKRCD